MRASFEDTFGGTFDKELRTVIADNIREFFKTRKNFQLQIVLFLKVLISRHRFPIP